MFMRLCSIYIDTKLKVLKYTAKAASTRFKHIRSMLEPSYAGYSIFLDEKDDMWGYFLQL